MNPKTTRKVSSLWTNIKGYTKVTTSVKQDRYHFILQHTQVFQSPIYNYCIRVSIAGHTKKQVLPKILLQVSVR